MKPFIAFAGCCRSVLLSSAMVLLVLPFATGCASFRSKTVQPAGAWPPAPDANSSNRPALVMHVKVTMQDELQFRKPTENHQMADYVRAVAARTARESGLFGSVEFDKSTAAKADYQITAEITTKASTGMGNFFWAFMSGATFCIIPCTFKETLVFTGQVQNRTGTELARLEYQEDVRTWFHLFMLPMFGKRPDTINEAVWQDMFKCFFQDLKNKKTLAEATANTI